MDILNIISWIKGGRRVTSVDPSKSLLPVGLKDDRRDDGYLPAVISVGDLAAQIGGGGPVVDAEGNLIVANSANDTVTVGPGATHDVPNFSGMVMVNDHFDGGVELWICGGGDCTLISTTTAAPGNSTFTQSGTNGYEWTNVDNLNGPFTFTVIKSRDIA